MRVLNDWPLELGEGPIYDPLINKSFWFDIVNRTLVELDHSLDECRKHALPFMVSAMALIDERRHLLVGENGLHFRDLSSGQLTPYLDIESDNPRTRSNDARVHPSGALWLGTMGKSCEANAGAIYHVFRGEVTRLYDQLTIPNAICFSPDGRVAYFTDTPKRLLMQVSVDPRSGRPLAEPTIFYEHSGDEGGLDGAIVDRDGCVWTALWGAGRIAVFSPTGRRLKSLAVPATQATCPAFFGRDAKQLLVTTAWQGMDNESHARDAMAGFTFALSTPVPGKFEPRIKL